MAEIFCVQDWQRRGQRIATLIHADVRSDVKDVDLSSKLTLACAALLGAAEALCDVGSDASANATKECRSLLAALQPAVLAAVDSVKRHWARAMPPGQAVAFELAYEAGQSLPATLARRASRTGHDASYPVFDCAYSVFNGAAMTFAEAFAQAGTDGMTAKSAAHALGVAVADVATMLALHKHPTSLATTLVKALAARGGDENSRIERQGAVG